MTNPLRPFLSLVAFAAIPTLLLAVYAPIPEQDQGKTMTYRLGASVYQDSNIFGASDKKLDGTGAVVENARTSSAVYNLSFGIAFNSSVSDQTFLSLGYDLSNDHVVDRPGNKDLTNHAFTSRLAHSFSKDTNIDISENYQINKSPESLLSGIPAAAEQSAKNNQFSVRFQTSAGEKGSVVLKYRNTDASFDNETLARGLDHNDHLAGLEGSYAFLPEVKLVGEYRYGQVNYKTNNTPAVGAFPAEPAKDKDSNYFMAGVDYNPNEKTTLTFRGGFENRNRQLAASTTSPYSEFSVNYAYAEGSFVNVAYTYALEEASDVVRFTDSKVNRFVGTISHHLSALIIASGSLTHESAVLQGRVGQANLKESATRFGAALTWQPTKNWNVSATLDVDHSTSGDINRLQDRTRYGIGAKFSF